MDSIASGHKLVLANGWACEVREVMRLKPSSLSFLCVFLAACAAELSGGDEGSSVNSNNSGNNSGSNNGSDTGTNTGDNGTNTPGTVAGVTNLMCDTFIWCSNWNPNSETPSLPPSGETTIPNGLYRLEAGSTSPIAIAFNGDKFSRILPNHLNLHGTFRISGDQLFFTNEVRCDEDGDFDVPNPFESSAQKFRVSGNELYFFDDVCAFDDCGPLWRFVRVEDLCTESGSFGCSGGNCVCDMEVNRDFQAVRECSE